MSFHLRLPKQPTITMFFLIIVSIAGGILFASQWRVRPQRVVNPVQPFVSLTDTRDALNDEQLSLKAQISQVAAEVEKRKNELAKTNQIDARLAASSNTALIEAGLTKVKGSGIVATLDDSPDGLLTDQAIAHAADLRDIVSLLQGVGAEAIAINDERVITTTAIDCIVNTILVNETRLSNPFVVTAIGDPDTLSRVLLDPAILQDLHRRVEVEGVRFTVETKDEVVISAYSGSLPGDNASLVL